MTRPKKREKQPSDRLVRRAECYRDLGITDHDVHVSAQITPLIEQLPDGWKTALAALRSSGSELAQLFLAYYDRPEFTSEHRLLLPIEAFSLAAGVRPQVLWEQIVLALVRQNAQMGVMLAAVNHPAIVQTSIKMAMCPKGVKDRELQLRHAGFLPQPKSNVINVNAVANSQAEVRKVEVQVPAPGETVRRLTDRFNEALRPREVPQLTAPPPVIDGE